jgi:hypothetical protein
MEVTNTMMLHFFSRCKSKSKDNSKHRHHATSNHPVMEAGAQMVTYW